MKWGYIPTLETGLQMFNVKGFDENADMSHRIDLNTEEDQRVADENIRLANRDIEMVKEPVEAYKNALQQVRCLLGSPSRVCSSKHHLPENN